MLEPVLVNQHGLLRPRRNSVTMENVRVEVDSTWERHRPGHRVDDHRMEHLVVVKRCEQALSARREVKLADQAIGELDPKHPGRDDVDLTDTNQ